MIKSVYNEQFMTSCRPGIYFKVLEEGEVKAGDKSV